VPYTNLSTEFLVLANGSTNPVFTTVALEARPAAGLQPPADRGFLLQRRYALLDETNGVHDSGAWKVGDRVLVSVRLTVREPARFVAVDDALPCILEAIKPNFVTQSAMAPGPGLQSEEWMDDYRELRKDRFLSFANDVSPGVYRLSYVARVRAAGTATAPAAKVEEMYHPERYGLSDTMTVSSQAD
jgi:uncharacterized protein YfaS (alpha-2-macroglobulin family)